MGEEAKPLGAVASGAIDPTADIEDLGVGMAEIRSLLQRTATAIGAIATAVLVGLGYSQLHEIFPVPKNLGHLPWPDGIKLAWVLNPLLVASLVAAVFGSAWLASRFFRAQRRILITSTLKGGDLDKEDRVLAEAVLAEHAAEEGAASLHALELRAMRFGRIARRLPNAAPPLKYQESRRAEEVAAEAKRLGEVVNLALGRAAATVLEDRARRVFRGWRTGVALGLAAGGIAGLFAIADFYDGRRGLFELREKCAKAETAGVPDACAAFETSAESDARLLSERAEQTRKGIREAFAAGAAKSAAQQDLLDRVTACSRQVNANAETRNLDRESKFDVIALCAAAE